MPTAKEKSKRKGKKKGCKDCASCQTLGKKFNKLITKPTAVAYSKPAQIKKKSKRQLSSPKLYSLEIGANVNIHTGEEKPIRMMLNKEFAEMMNEGKAPDITLLGNLNELGLKKKKKKSTCLLCKKDYWIGLENVCFLCFFSLFLS